MDHFSGQDGGQAAALKEMPSFIKPAPASSASTGQGGGASGGGHSVKKTGIALDSLEPVIVSGVSTMAGSNNTASAQTQMGTASQNNPSPQNFASSQKGLDLLTGGDILEPRGDPQLVGLTRLAYEAGGIQLAQSGTVEACSAEDFQDCFIERTLNHYYKSTTSEKGSQQRQKAPRPSASLANNNNNNNEAVNSSNTLDSGGESPERTGTSKQRARDTSGGSRRGAVLNRSLDGKGGKGDERRATSLLLQHAKRAPYEYCKVAFLIKLPYEMQIEQIQFLLPHQSEESSQSSGAGANQNQNQDQPQPSNLTQQKQRSAPLNSQMIINNSHIASVESQQQQKATLDHSFSANFKILNISTLKSLESVLAVGPQQSTESRHKTSLYGKGNQSRLQREHRHIAIKSAFSEDVTGKNMIEVNACAVTKYLHVTLLCLRTEVVQVLNRWKQQASFCSSRKSKTSAFDNTAKAAQLNQGGGKNEQKVTGAQRLIAEILDFDILDEHDQEVAFISKQHYQQDSGAQDGGIIDHEQIALQLRGDENDFDRDSYDDDLDNFKVGNIIHNDEDDLRILDSLPIAVKPKNLRNSFNSRKQNSTNKQKSGKADGEQQQQTVQVQGPLAHFLDKIVVYGFNTNSIPAITNLTYFMNQAFYLRKMKKYYQAEEVDCLIGTLMITTKRATQAAEFFRRMENQIVKKISRNLSKLEKQGSDVSSHNATFQVECELRTETQNLLLQCAVYELVISDGLSCETQLNEKIQALGRVVAFTEGQIPMQMKFAPQVLVSDDSFSALLRILPQLLRFCILSLTHRREIVRMSALKVLKFVLETQGCSLDASMIYILKGMFLTYPCTSSSFSASHSQNDKDAAEKIKKQSSLDESPSPKSVNSQKVLEERDSATARKQNSSKQRVKVVLSDFDLALLVGESEAATMTVSDYIFQGQFRNPILSNSANNIGESHLHPIEPESTLYATKFAEIQEPSSGFSNALMNVYSHVLETFISVLSSISSHILHRIFYDVIEDALCATPQDQAKSAQAPAVHSASFKGQQHSVSGAQSQMRQQARALMGQSSQIKVYACKIAEKIITICQGDLNMSPNLLNALVDYFSSSKPQLPMDSANNQAHAAMKNLWSSIKQKVFPNYSTKGYRKLIEWISTKMHDMIKSPKTHSQDLLGTKPESQRKDAFPDELSDEENVTLLQLCEVINIVTFNRLKQEEEANQLIKLPTAESFGNGASAEMYLLIPELIFFFEYSIDREDRLQLFTQLYQTIKDVLESVPTNGRSRENQLNVVQIVMPSLRRTSDFLSSHSPSLPMLKFLDIVLTDIQLCAHERKNKQQQNLSLSPQQMQTSRQQPGQNDNSVADPLKLQGFFLELLENFVTSLSYSFYEEAFSVFDKLLYLTGDAISETTIKKCIVALVDKYTLKSKSHKASMTTFMKSLMDLKVKRTNTQSPNVSRVQTNHNRNLSSPGSPEFEDMMNENDLSSQNHQGNYFEVMAEFCFFENVDTKYKAIVREGVVRAVDDKQEHNVLMLPQLDMRGPMDMHELFIDKLQFFIDSLALMTEAHIGMFTYLITNNSFKTVLLQLLEHGETHVRMKAHEILEALTSYYVQCCPSKTVYEFPAGAGQGREGNLLPEGTKKMEAEFIAHERLFISQIVIQVAKKSLQQTNDCYLQFNALILLDFLFQNLLPVPTFQNEQVKARKMNRRQTPSAQEPADVELTMDIEVLSISDMTPELDVMDPAYLRMRMKLVLSLWPNIQAALASPWSNIRSICYGLICSMLKINVADYPLVPDQQALSREIGNQATGTGQQLSPTNNLSEIIADHAALSADTNKDQLIMSDILSINVATQARLKEIVLPMLYSLLSSKESESKAGGLNILGSFCGLSYDFSQVKINQNLAFLQRNSLFISLPIWRLVYQLQDDWDITIKEASVVLVQLCAPRNAILYFQSLKEKRQQKKLTYMMNQMPNVQSIYVRRGFIEAEDEEEKNLVRGMRPESRLSVKNFLVKRNEYAARAYLRFPSDQDIEVILNKQKHAGKSVKTPSEELREASFSWMQHDSTLLHDAMGDQHGNFSEFLAGKVPFQPTRGIQNVFELQAVSCQMIEQENQILVEKVHAFNPDYEDTRFVRNLSRKRQLEIELDMPSRGRRANNETNLNFFVDTYSDEQIQEIISIFRNDFKPPKNLWIEKQPSPLSLVSGGMSHGAMMAQNQQQNMRSQSPDYYQDIYAEAIEQFNQQQQQMQQQQQAQLQQQVQSGSSSNSSVGSSREPSPLSQTTTPSPVASIGADGQPVPILATEPTAAARLSPQPAGKMMDPLEDDQLRKYAEEHHQKQLSASQGSSAKSNHSKGSSQAKSHHSSLEDDSKKSAHHSSIGVQPFGSEDEGPVDMDGDRKASTGGKEKSQASGWQAGGEGQHPGQQFATGDEMAGKPFKSESMGLLDAEGYKFLEASDSNSDHEVDDDEIVVDHIAEAAHESQQEASAELIYEMRPPMPQQQPKKKQHRRQLTSHTMKIESLNFDNIQICGMSSQPPQQLQAQSMPSQPKKKAQHKAKIPKFSVEQQVGRIEFYEEPMTSEDMPQQNSSRLGQRSSRLYAAQVAQGNNASLMEQRKNSLNDAYIPVDGKHRDPDEEARYIKTQKLFKKLKSPTDKLSGVNNFKSFNAWEQTQPEAAIRNKSNESRKRKKSLSNQTQSKPNKSFQKGKPTHLQLLENDYFSAEDKHINHLKNLTQKAVSHQYQGGLGSPWNWATNPASKGSGTGQSTTRPRTKSISNANSVSTPEFNALQNKLSQKAQQQQQQLQQAHPSSNGKLSQDCLEATGSQEMLDQNKISRKMAQTYLSGLSKGFIANMDNLKLINTCLTNQQQEGQQSTAAGSSSQTGVVSNKTGSTMLNKSLGSANANHAKPHQQLKVVNKSFENLGAQAKLKQSNNNGSLLVDLQLMNPKSTVSYQTQRSRGGKNSTLSTSPKRRDGSQTTRMGSSANYQRKQKSLEKGMGKKSKQVQQRASSDSKGGINAVTANGSNKKVSGNISDLHLFIKTIERDLTEKFRNMQDIGVKGPATPNQILRKVEDQMRAFGIDPKSGSNQATAQALALKFAQTEQLQHSSGNQQSQEKKRKKSLPPKLKLLGLNQVFPGQNASGQVNDPSSAALYATSNQNITPSNLSSNGSGSYAFMAKSHINIHGGTHFSASTKKKDGEQYQRSSGSRRRKRSGPRDRSAESRTSRQRTKSGRLSTGRGASSGSGGRGGGAISHQVPHPPMVMTERQSLRPARTGGKSSQERHFKNNKSLTKGGGSALARPSKKPKLAKQKTASPEQQPPQIQVQNSAQQPTRLPKGQVKLNKSKESKGTSLSAMNQIATGVTADPKLLHQILQGTGGSISVRNSDQNWQGAKSSVQKGGTNPQQMTNPFLLGKNSTQKMTPGSTKGSQTNRFQGQTNILLELMQNQEAQRHSKKNREAVTLINSQSGSQSSRTPQTTSGQSIKMIKNKKMSQQQQASQQQM